MIPRLYYNTQHAKILFKEYGRGVQDMITYALTIDDRQKRNRVAQAIVKVMGELQPAQNKKNPAFQHKLWDHLHIIANFELDVDSPFPKPRPEDLHHPLHAVSYPRLHIQQKHYGRHLEILIQRAIAMTETDKKAAMVRVIAHYMKMVHRNLNNEIVSDETVRRDLRSLSKGALDISLNDSSTLVVELDPLAPTKRKRKRSRNKSRGQEEQSHTTNSNNHTSQKQQVSNTHRNTPQKHSQTPTNKHHSHKQQQQHTRPQNPAPPAIESPNEGGGKRKRNRNRKKK